MLTGNLQRNYFLKENVFTFCDFHGFLLKKIKAKDQIGLTEISIFQPINNTEMGTTTQNTILSASQAGYAGQQLLGCNKTTKLLH